MVMAQPGRKLALSRLDGQVGRKRVVYLAGMPAVSLFAS